MDFGIMGAITGLIGAGLNASAQAAQQQIQWAQLQFQKDQARKQNRFASAARSDQYGNKNSYDDIANEWKIALTPMQGKITKAGEREQLLQLTEDAPAARKQRQALQKRAQQAAPLFEQAMNAYKYREPKSEGAIKDEITNLLATNELARAKDNQAIIGRQALRLGRGQDIPKLIKATDDQLGSGQAETMLKARQGAIEERGQRIQQRDAELLPAIKMYASLMENGGQMPDLMPSTTSGLPQTQNAMASAMQQAMAQGAGQVGQAYQGLANSVGKSVDLSGIANILAKIGTNTGLKNSSGTSFRAKDQDRILSEGVVF